ncbi:TolC family protein [Vineibacter terrae]|uniref:TolC family protein n=1 Tax=Vineibacter terrae TaxID=2586908 RepID=A0A5C8PTU0_9HYPH|nr:TolC family protein [Vineibacter terrae]TXL80327.1 TolC family protein [Vineibacter terrae]
MLLRCISVGTLVLALALPGAASAQAPGPLTLAQALQRALSANARLFVADREIGMAEGRRTQAGAIPNPEASFELDNALGSRDYRGLRSAETTLQLSQLIELGGKRGARVAAASADHDSARWQRAAARLEILSETATAFVAVLGAQQRVALLDRQLAALDRMTPQMQQRVDAGASSPADVARTKVATELTRIDRDRARKALEGARRDLALLMGRTAPDFTYTTGNLARIAPPPSFQTLLQAIESNPQLMRWTAVRAQKEAELLTARLKVVPDVQASVGWRHYRDTRDNAVRFGVSIPIPVWDRNRGAIYEAQEAIGRTEAERAANKQALTSTVGRAYDAATGALQEIGVLRRAVLPNARAAFDAINSGYAQGRFTVLELLEAYKALAEAELREQETLVSFHTAVATIEGLTGSPLTLGGGRTP